MKPSKPVIPHFDLEGKVNLPKGHYLKAVKNADKGGHNDVFIMVFRNSYPAFRELRTITAFRVCFVLMVVMMEQGKYELIITQAEIAKHVGCAAAEVSKAISELERVDIILTHSRGVIVVNPRYLWKGYYANMQEAVKDADINYNKELK